LSQEGDQIMRKTFLFALGCIALAGAIWASNDPWKDKPYQQWDSKDIQRIIQDSPWAHVVQVAAPWQQGGPTVATLSSGTAPTDGPSGRMAGAGSGMAGSGGAGSPATPVASDPGGSGGTANFLVRWISSRTFREAMVRDRVLRGQMTDADAQADLAKPPETYEVAIIGPDMTPFQGVDENALKNAAYLSAKRSKVKLVPTMVRIQKSQDGSRVTGILFAFPAKSDNGEPSIASEEKNVDFSCTIGKFSLKSTFDVSKMADSQGRDL
jgi:hypothetical protein